MASSLKPSQVVGEARRLLEEGGFTEADHVEVVPARPWRAVDDECDEADFVDPEPLREILVFEDERSIVGLIFYPAWGELETNWELAQAAMVQRISAHFRRIEPKSWDGYLVLLTLDEMVPVEVLAQVRHDTHRLRKLVATGRELTTMASVEDALLPVLPFKMAGTATKRIALVDRLSEMLEDRGVDCTLATVVLASFRENRSPMEGIWSWRQAQ